MTQQKWIYTTTGHEQNKDIKAKQFDLFLHKTNSRKSDVNGAQYANWIKHHIEQYNALNGRSGAKWLYHDHADDFLAFLEKTPQLRKDEA